MNISFKYLNINTIILEKVHSNIILPQRDKKPFDEIFKLVDQLLFKEEIVGGSK